MSNNTLITGGARSGKSRFAEELTRNLSASFRFQFKDDIKAARNSATQAYTQYVEEPKTSQRRERLEMEAESLCYLATAQGLDGEMDERIHRHRLRRGTGWETIEEPLMIPQTLARIDGIYRAILLDCVTLWLSNLLLSCDEDDPGCEEQVLNHVHRLAATLRGMSTPVVLVTNEVGQGIVPENRLARLYREIAGQTKGIGTTAGTASRNAR